MGGDQDCVLILWMTIPLLGRMSTATALALLNMMVNTDIDALALQSPDLGSVDQLARDDDTREDVVAKDRNQCVLPAGLRQEIGIIGG
jgi:hypothetical protein